MTSCNILNELLQVIPNIIPQVWLISCISKVFTSCLLRYTYNRGTPQIQLSYNNHFLETAVRRERLMMWKSCEEGDVFSTVLPLLLTSFQPPYPHPHLSERLKSLRYIIGANQWRMRKALRWNSWNYLPPQPACSLCPLSLSHCPHVLW